jgi:hypothetical protein
MGHGFKEGSDVHDTTCVCLLSCSVALHANRKSLGELSGLGVGVGRPRALPRDDSGDLLLGQSPPNNPPLSPGSGGAQSEPQTPLLSLEAEVFSVHVGNTHSTVSWPAH